MTADPNPLLSPGPEHAASEAALAAWTVTRDADLRAAIETDLWGRFGHRLTVVVVDMCGFSRRASNDGLIGALAMIASLRVVIAQVAVRHGGRTIKFEADNAFLTFDDTAGALAAARDALRCLRAAADRPIEISVGIDRGPILLLDGTDLYGEPVNTASKLGEDIARRGEILLTPEAVADLDDAAGLIPVTLDLSGLAFAAFADPPD